ncbi:hypothetical protein HGP17_02730 [Rhizobium sp. P38BS-XIX]|uniref:DUF6105 family protein n=1 Tax=Rhizobium sp. P38BS-XIX TaxID=2726740 RepID=UPI0014577122|nr:DUF6105 family protein [Rhizobium sp. P38BS-XIX]NLR95749.1 hypothetical protein [Rhizobium sp. P38BS-XIX]
MKWLLICWAAPVSFLGAWYYLSYYDINFGIFMLTRQTHDLVFAIYGKVLGIPPETIPPLVARAIAFDSVLVFAIFGFRRRAAIMEWWHRRQASRSGKVALPSADSLSNAP